MARLDAVMVQQGMVPSRQRANTDSWCSPCGRIPA